MYMYMYVQNGPSSTSTSHCSCCSIAGSHGTGLSYGNMASFVTSISFISGTGKVRYLNVLSLYLHQLIYFHVYTLLTLGAHVRGLQYLVCVCVCLAPRVQLLCATERPTEGTYGFSSTGKHFKYGVFSKNGVIYIPGSVRPFHGVPSRQRRLQLLKSLTLGTQNMIECNVASLSSPALLFRISFTIFRILSHGV